MLLMLYCRTNEQEQKEKRRSKKQRIERNVAKGKTVIDLLSAPPAVTSSAAAVTLQKTFSPPSSLGSGIVAGGTATKRPAEATFPKFYASGLMITYVIK